MDDAGKKFALSEIMGKAHALVDVTCPGGGPTSPEVLRALIDIQIAACKALKMPEDLDLMTGGPEDLI